MRCRMDSFTITSGFNATTVRKSTKQFTQFDCGIAGQRTSVNEVLSRIRSGAKIIQISGFPLVGKSYVAHKVASELSCNALQWFGSELDVHTIGLRGRVSSVQHLRQAVLDSLGCVSLGIAENPRRFWRILEHVPEMLLFIFENVEVVSENKEFQEEFLEFCYYICHASEKLHLILTSRIHYRLEREPSMFHNIDIQPLIIEDSRYLFRSIAGDLGLWEHQLVPLCAGIPHVIVIVAKAIRDHLYTPEKILSILKSTGLVAFAIDSSGNTTLHNEIDKGIQRLTGMYLKKRCVDLVYIPGTFSAEAAAYINDLSIAATKLDVIDPLNSISLILRGDPQCERFHIHTFVRAMIEERYGFLRNESLIRNRYCKFFAQLLQRMAPMAERSRGQKFRVITQELTNLEKLLQQAVHLIEEHYELFFDIAYNAEYLIINLLPKKESVDFYEALMNTAKLKDPRQYGILLSSFGQVLNFAQTRYSQSYDQFRKSVEYLRPFGDSHDLAWVYCHIGYYWFEVGCTKKAERFMLTSCNMIRRVKKQVTMKEKWYKDTGVLVPRGFTQSAFKTDRLMTGIVSYLGMLYTEIGRVQEAVQYHNECLEIRRLIYGFHPTIGSCYNNLSEAYEKMGDFQRALEFADKGLTIKKHFIKDPSNAVIDSLINVARLTMKTGGDTNHSLTLLQEAYEQRSELGLPHFQALCILHETGTIWYHRKEYHKSIQVLQDAIVMLELIESTCRQRGDTLRMLGLALQGTGQLQKAAEMLAKSLQEQEKMSEIEKNEEDIVKAKTTINELTAVEKKRGVYV